MITTFWTPKGDINISVPGLLAGGSPQLMGIFSLTKTTDPGVNDDSSTGVAVGSIWFNNTAGKKRTWKCYDATVGAAKWVFMGADYTNGGTNPVTEVTAFGGGAGLMAEEGNIDRQISATGVNPGATGADNVLAFTTIPASSFDAAGRGVNITVQGSIASNVNVKDVKIIYNPATAVVGSTVGAGGTTIADTGAVSGTTTKGGFALSAQVFKYGALGANTQLGLHTSAQVGPTALALAAPALLTGVESGPILVAVTGNATTTATDIVFNFLEVNAMN